MIQPVGRAALDGSEVTLRSALIKRARAIKGVSRRPLKMPSSEESLERKK